MANFDIFDYTAAAAKTFKSSEAAGVHVPHKIIDAGEAHIGEIGGKTVVKDVVLTLTATTYTAGTVLAATQLVNGFFRKTDGTGIVQSIVVADKDDQKAAVDIYFLNSGVSLGSENAAPSITDADALFILGCVSVAASDYKDLGGASVATIRNIGLPVMAETATDDIYVAMVSNGSTPTYTTSGVVLRIGVLLD